MKIEINRQREPRMAPRWLYALATVVWGVTYVAQFQKVFRPSPEWWDLVLLALVSLVVVRCGWVWALYPALVEEKAAQRRHEGDV